MQGKNNRLAEKCYKEGWIECTYKSLKTDKNIWIGKLHKSGIHSIKYFVT